MTFSYRRARAALVAAASVVSLVATLSPAACSSSDSCVDFTLTATDQACSIDSDCTFIDELRVCPGDGTCGGEIPVNVAAESRYESATGNVRRTSVQCGAPSPVRCVNDVCALAP
jgi:hypothetical protein